MKHTLEPRSSDLVLELMLTTLYQAEQWSGELGESRRGQPRQTPMEDEDLPELPDLPLSEADWPFWDWWGDVD
jgi:hypothetical protein